MSEICIVTGGSSGTGKATALLALSRGYRDYNFYLSPPESEPSESCGIFVKCDVTNRNDVDEAVSSVFARESRIDALVVSAGVHFSANIEQTTEDDFNRIMDVNTKALFPAKVCDPFYKRKA